MASPLLPIPAPIKKFFSLFPLYRYPANLPPPTPLTNARGAVLLIAPPAYAKYASDSDLFDLPPGVSHLSADPESLRWQAYIALHKVNNVHISWAVGLESGVPKLVLPAGSRKPLGVDIDSLNESLGEESSEANERADINEKTQETVEAEAVREVIDPGRIPAWVDEVQGRGIDALEGFIDAATRDESRAWVALLEGVVRSALLLATPPPPFLESLLRPKPTGVTIQSTLSPPPPPLVGLSTPLPLPQTLPRVSSKSLKIEFKEAMHALDGRLGSDEWFLGSREPTGVDALLFAYLHCLLDTNDEIRREVTQRPNLASWHHRVKRLVEDRLLPLQQ
ncbi:Glutathione S-transferase, C-terminal domain [Rhizoctonia solani]|uniref:Glutathione S-transferase, C-terminal domain n=1 Tax=Rhizoctonia solani TaxID=456999 RepID=A0A8H7HB65_9AGAM|nr:Glutathione S-transferase, C-terminal domain [Rhizoctonia solani]